MPRGDSARSLMPVTTVWVSVALHCTWRPLRLTNSHVSERLCSLPLLEGFNDYAELGLGQGASQGEAWASQGSLAGGKGLSVRAGCIGRNAGKDTHDIVIPGHIVRSSSIGFLANRTVVRQHIAEIQVKTSRAPGSSWGTSTILHLTLICGGAVFSAAAARGSNGPVNWD